MFTGLIAYAPVNAPVFSLLSSVLSKSDLEADFAMYASTCSLFSLVVILLTNGCSGERTQYVAPNNVSGLVVNTVNFSSLSATVKVTSAPTDLPIQFLCISFVDSGQSISSKPLSKISAYLGMSITHCFIFFLTTGNPPLSLLPSITSSLESTVPNSSHQLTGISTSLTKPSL